MSRQTMIVAAISILVVVGAVSAILFSTRENRVRLEGEVLKVRSHQIDPEHTFAILDIRLSNPSTQEFVVREVEVFVEDQDGTSRPADLFAEPDARRVLEFYPTIGGKYTPGLLRKDKIPSGATTDRSIAVSAPMTDDQVGRRKAFRIIIQDVDGPKTEVVEKR